MAWTFDSGPFVTLQKASRDDARIARAAAIGGAEVGMERRVAAPVAVEHPSRAVHWR
jgi:hypothetical protein